MRVLKLPEPGDEVVVKDGPSYRRVDVLRVDDSRAAFDADSPSGRRWWPYSDILCWYKDNSRKQSGADVNGTKGANP